MPRCAHPSPGGRQFALRRSSVPPQQAGSKFDAQIRQLFAPVVDDAIFAFESQQKAGVEELQKGQVLLRLGANAIHHRKEFSPPHVSEWNSSRRLFVLHALALPQGVVMTASSTNDESA